jgi:hypothetical protein
MKRANGDGLPPSSNDKKLLFHPSIKMIKMAIFPHFPPFLFGPTARNQLD